MNFKEKLSPSAQKKLSDLLFIFYAGGAALLSYSLVYALRKPFTAATFDGMELFGMDYKVATSIIQIFGYMVSKFIGIKLISELKREGRLKFILVSIGVAELSLVLFGTGLTDLDRMTSGLQNSDLIVLAARPGVGKTGMACIWHGTRQWQDMP